MLRRRRAGVWGAAMKKSNPQTDLDRLEALGWDCRLARKIERIGDAAAKRITARLKSEGWFGIALLDELMREIDRGVLQ